MIWRLETWKSCLEVMVLLVDDYARYKEVRGNPRIVLTYGPRKDARHR